MLTFLSCVAFITLTADNTLPAQAQPEPALEPAVTEQVSAKDSAKNLEMELGKQALHDNMIPVAMLHFQRAARLDPNDPTPRWILEYCQTLIWDARDAHSPPGYPYRPGGQYGWRKTANITIGTAAPPVNIEDDGFTAPPADGTQPQGRADPLPPNQPETGVVVPASAAAPNFGGSHSRSRDGQRKKDFRRTSVQSTTRARGSDDGSFVSIRPVSIGDVQFSD
jgi:hypothetical protein